MRRRVVHNCSSIHQHAAIGPRCPAAAACVRVAIDVPAWGEQIFELLLRAARSKLRFVALLSVHADHIRGRRALGDERFDCSRVTELRITRNAVPAFESAIASRVPSVGSLATGELFIDGLLEVLGGSPRAALVMPVTIGSRTVALVVAHRGDDGLTTSDVADLFPLMNASDPALARVLAERSKSAASRPARGDTEYDVEIAIEGIAGKRAALAAHRKHEAWPEVVETIRELIRDGMDTGQPDEDEQLDLLIELGHVQHEKLGRPERAIESWRSAQSIDASDVRVLDALDALFVQQGRWVECAELLEKRVALTEGKQPRIGLLLELAAMVHERLDDEERAIEAYQRILTWDPEHETASQQLESLYWSRKQWEPLAALLLDRAGRHEDPQARLSALEAVAQMYEDKVGDARAALLVWLAVFERAPERPHLLDHIDRLAPEADAWEEVVAQTGALAEELEVEHPHAAASLWHLAGRWTRDRLANRDGAVHALDRALRLQPTDFDALFELLDLLRAEGRWIDLIALLSHRAQIEDDLGRRSELYTELGDIHEVRLGQVPEAIAFYERALACEPEGMPAQVALHRLYLATGAWAALGELLPRLIEALAADAPPAILIDLHVELGGVLADHLNRPEDAVRAFREAIAIDPTHAAAHAGIERVYLASGQSEALIDATETAVDASGRADQLQRYGDLAAAWHEHARFDRAAACWQKLLALDPNHSAAHHGLVRALREGQRWAPLVVALYAQIRIVAEPRERIALLIDLATLFETRLHDEDGAIAACREILGLEPHHRTALDTLARIHDRAGRLQPALATLLLLLEQTTTEPRVRADVLQRIGHVHLAARDAVNARLSFVQAIAADRESAPAHEGMARVQIQQGELVAAGEELVRAAQLSTTQSDRIRCLADAAWLYRHRLHDPGRARACLQQILDLVPDHADATQAFAELLAETQEWQTLWPHLEQQVERARSDESVSPAERLEIFTKAARCAVELANFATALECYDLASAIDQGPATALERANAVYRSKALEAAGTSYQAIIARHSAALERPQLVAVFRRLAAIHTELGKPSQALLFHHKVLDLEPGHRDTLGELTELHLARGAFDDAITSLRSLVEAAPPAERPTYLERIGDLYRDKLTNRARALSTYLEALEIDAANRRVLQRVLDLQSEAGQWKAAVETIDRFLVHETDPARRGAYFLAAAEIRRTELKDRASALGSYEQALDELLRAEPLAPATRTRALEAFRIIEELVTATEDWKALEQTYRRTLKRLPKDDPLLLQLWHSLGEIYRTRLQHTQSAIEAFEVAHSLDPAKPAHRARILAELYAQAGAGTRSEGVSARAAKLVEVDPTNPDAYRALGQASLEAGGIDEAWCVCRALVILKKANPKEQALYQQYKSEEVRKATGILDEDSWAHVRHADEDRAISAIFSLVWEAPVALRAGPPKSFELKPKERMPIEHDTRVVAKIFRHAARLLNVPLPDVYVQPRRPGRLLLANCIDKARLAPAVIVGRDLMTGYRDTEIAAAVGAMLALLRPAYYLKLTLATIDELEAVLAATAQLVGRKIGRPQLEPLIATFVPEIEKRLTRPMAETVQGLVHRLPEHVDLARWRNALDAAAQRAALLVSGDLAATARMISSEMTVSGGLRPNQRVQELVAYSVSPGYFAVRRHLGVTVT